MIISFAATTEALLAGRKTMTRRRWKQRHYDSWLTAFQLGWRRHKAYDRSPRCGGRQIGWIWLTGIPYWERLCDMPEEDVAAEGGLWKDKAEFVEAFGCDPQEPVVVLRFEFEKLGSDGELPPGFVA